jgi:2,4-diketo-3-deoxy-L-fuconate hydrolase
VETTDPTTLPRAAGQPHNGVPVAGIGKIVAIGLNYRDQGIKSNMPIPTEPMMFL